MILEYKVLGLTRHHAQQKKKKSNVHGLDTTDFEVSNVDKITLNFHGK